MTRNRKWLQQALAALDPETDYEQMMRLKSLYEIDELALNLAYTVNFMGVVVTPQGANALMHTGKVVNKPQRRFDDSIDFLLTWYVLGPSHAITRASVERLNRMHAAVGRGIPESFSDNADYLQALCLVALFDHRVRLIVGLPGLDERTKRMYHHWLRDLSTHFTTGTPSGRIDAFPSTWEGLLEFAEAFEARQYTPHEGGQEAARALVDQFCQRQFPKWPRLGRTLVLVFTPPRVRRAHGLDDPNPVAAFLIRRIFRVLLVLRQHVLPDPRESLLERLERQGRLSPVLTRTLEALRQIPSPKLS